MGMQNRSPHVPIARGGFGFAGAHVEEGLREGEEPCADPLIGFTSWKPEKDFALDAPVCLSDG